MQLQLAVLALLTDGVHLGEEDGGDENPGDGDNGHGHRRVVEGGRGKVVDEGPANQH